MDNTKDVETIVLLKYQSNFWRTLEIPLDHEITLKILGFILNLIEKVKPDFLLSSMCVFTELNRTKF